MFDADGHQVCPAADTVICVTASALNVHSGPETGYGVVMTLPNGGGGTIVGEQDGWGRLKSGARWICLQDTERVSYNQSRQI
ncbi:MAG: SH3 domain-containing protein [Oscillospiraceae bacterium]|nr:SH3 domain-containing protein [Oscillospiraceae bacterium]